MIPHMDLPSLIASATGVLAGGIVIAFRWELGLYLVAILMPYEGILGNGGNISGMKIVVAVILIAAMVRLPFDRVLGKRLTELLYSPLVSCLAVFVAWSFLSVLWASFPADAVGSSVTFVGDFLLLMLVAMLDVPGIVRVWRLFVWSAAISVPVAVALALAGLVGGPGGRLTLAGLNADAYSPTLLIAAWVCLVGLQFRSRTIKPLLIVVLLAGALMTQTRTGLVAFVIGGVLAFVFAAGPARRLIFRRFTGLALAACMATIVVAALAPSYAKQSLERLGTAVRVEEPHSLTGRKSLWAGALRMWESSPLTGVGSGNYVQLSADYSSYAAKVLRARGHREPAHNMYLAVLSELGLPGAALFFTVLVFILWRLRALSVSVPFASGLLAAYCVYLVAGFALNWSYIKLPYLIAGSVLALQASMPKLEVEGQKN